MTALRPARLRVLIAAPLPADVGAVAAVLGTAGHEVLTAYRLDAVVARLVAERPDVLVVDPAIGEGSAADLVSRLGGYSDAPLLVLADLVDEALVVEALTPGRWTSWAARSDRWSSSPGSPRPRDAAARRAPSREPCPTASEWTPPSATPRSTAAIWA